MRAAVSSVTAENGRAWGEPRKAAVQEPFFDSGARIEACAASADAFLRMALALPFTV